MMIIKKELKKILNSENFFFVFWMEGKFLTFSFFWRGMYANDDE